jgi:ADP-ribose pyrophosphatase
VEHKIVYSGDLFQLVSTIEYSEKHQKIRIFEKAHRPPGVRMVIVHENKILLTCEERTEIKDWDYRLPGGKVFDQLSEYLKNIDDSCRLEQAIKEAVVAETRQETGLHVEISDLRFLHKSVAGASVIWDLFYYEIEKFEVLSSGQELEEGENIKPPVWKSFDEILEMCLNGEIKEDRSVAVLLRYCLKSGRK